jgi:dihydrofolate reductase
MGRLFAHISVSMDGFINDRAGELAWWSADEEFNRYVDGMLTTIGGMILGRRAFDALARFWPTAGPEMSATQRRRMHELPKYVLSHTSPQTAWHNSHMLGADPAAAIRSLLQNSPHDLAVFAGAGAIQSSFVFGLLDELRLVVHPVLLGSGTPLFNGSQAHHVLELTDTHRLDSGLLVLRYALNPASDDSDSVRLKGSES